MLNYLDFSHNPNIVNSGLAGLAVLKRIISRLPLLTDLRLGSMQLDRSAFIQILDAGNGRSIRYLDISQNLINYSTKQRMKEFIRRLEEKTACEEPESIRIFDNFFSQETKKMPLKTFNFLPKTSSGTVECFRTKFVHIGFQIGKNILQKRVYLFMSQRREWR